MFLFSCAEGQGDTGGKASKGLEDQELQRVSRNKRTGGGLVVREENIPTMTCLPTNNVLITSVSQATSMSLYKQITNVQHLFECWNCKSSKWRSVLGRKGKGHFRKAR